MKNLLFFLALLFIGQASQAQQLDTASWCPPGAMWLYGTTGTGAYYHTYTYEKDTLYQGLNTKKINHSVFQLFYNMQGNITGRTDYGVIKNFFLYNSNDSIYYWNDSTNSFLLLYDFGAVVGDSLTVRNPPNNNCYISNYPSDDIVEIVSLDTFSYPTSNLSFPTYYLDSYLNYNSYYYNLDGVYRNIGGINSFFPIPNPQNCNDYDYLYNGLDCYTDNIRGDVNFGYIGSIGCRSLILHVEQHQDLQQNNEQEIILFPNPNSGIAYFDDTNIEYPLQYELYDLNGRLLQTKEIITNEIILNELAAGVYILRFRTNDGKTAFSKIVKQ